ncbi:hypothetical protein CesoFtcFv8_013784 [Champsocephalus esox]|uniref:Uncharacterized protein n=2 Tax=Champsocephalus TaxID=52236 RepID=A0AAN8DGS7_CHAGU|nr:hypothetical protein CesoFtcFv8_013784 [Champsocephalus esox]KAK5920763.1 hypothetical protein CgunFtcFv8_024536 [Champsocephalus gunnari]
MLCFKYSTPSVFLCSSREVPAHIGALCPREGRGRKRVCWLATAERQSCQSEAGRPNQAKPCWQRDEE